MPQIQDCYACSIIKVLFEKQTIIFNNGTVHVVFPNEPFCLLLLLGCFQKKNRTEPPGSHSSQKSGVLTNFLLPLSCAIFWAPKLFRLKKRRQRETFSCQPKGYPPFVNSPRFHLSFYILSCTFIFIFHLQKSPGYKNIIQWPEKHPKERNQQTHIHRLSTHQKQQVLALFLALLREVQKQFAGYQFQL